MKRFVLFLSGCAILAALVWYAGLPAVERALALLGLHGIAILAGLHLPLLAGLGFAWQKASGRAAPLWIFITARFIRESAADMLPFSQLGGLAAGLRATSLLGLRRGALSLFADLVAEFCAKLPYAVAGLLLLLFLEPGADILVPLGLGIAVVSGVVAVVIAYRRFLLAQVTRAAQKIIGRWTNAELEPEAVAAAFARPRFLASFVVHVLCWFLGAVECWVIFALMDAPLTPLHAVVLDSLVNALRSFAFFIPAAAGVQEGAYILVCAIFGIPPAQALAFSLARRAREIALGLLGLAVWQVLEITCDARRRAERPQPNPAAPRKGVR